MRVLDIDLDFFLDDIVHRPRGNARPSGLSPWSASEVRGFLEKNCALRAESRVPALRVNSHDEVFDSWRAQIRDRFLRAPFHVVHIDAHPDLGLGYSSHARILTETLHLDPADRQNPARGGWSGLAEGNYLAYAVACRWIASITYVHHPKGGGNVPWALFRDHDMHSGVIELARLPRGTTGFSRPPKPLSLEPPVPYTELNADDYRDTGCFDFAYLSMSPRYTPIEADELVPIFEEYLEFGR